MLGRSAPTVANERRKRCFGSQFKRSTVHHGKEGIQQKCEASMAVKNLYTESREKEKQVGPAHKTSMPVHNDVLPLARFHLVKVP